MARPAAFGQAVGDLMSKQDAGNSEPRQGQTHPQSDGSRHGNAGQNQSVCHGKQQDQDRPRTRDEAGGDRQKSLFPGRGSIRMNEMAGTAPMAVMFMAFMVVMMAMAAPPPVAKHKEPD